MAGIDKIYLDKNHAKEFYEYLHGVDDDFRFEFPNAPSILDYSYYEYMTDDWNDNDVRPVSNFPNWVDAWLCSRKDLPDFVRDYIVNHQYGGGDPSEDPVTALDLREYSSRFRVVSHTRYAGRKECTAMSFFAINVFSETCPEHWLYYPDKNKFVSSNHVPKEYLGLPYWYGSSEYPFKSLKSVFRWIRKHKFPKDVILTVTDFKYESSTIKIKMI